MNKHLLSTLAVFITFVISAQVYTPFGSIQSTINNTQNIGIGINNPEHKLDIQGHIRVNTNSTHSSIILGRKTNTNIFSDDSVEKYYGGGMFFRVHNETIPSKYIDALLISEKGNVGIGTNNPNYKLSVQGHSLSTAHTIQSWSPTIYLKRDTNQGGYIQGIQTQLLNGDNNWFFGNLHADSWIVAKGDYTGSLFKISSSGNASLQGKLEAKEIKVTTTPTADFVFADSYNLPTLETVEKHIKEKRHLPEIASAKEMEKEGVNIGEFQIKLLQKIEELTLYSIEQNKKIKELEEKIEKLVNK